MTDETVTILVLLAVVAVFMVACGLIAWHDHRHPEKFDHEYHDDYDTECCGGGVQEEWR